MCEDCGCGIVGSFKVETLVDGKATGATHASDALTHAHEHRHPDGTSHSHPHSHDHPHGPDHPHDDHHHGHHGHHHHGHGHGHPHPETLDLHAPILAHNDRLAERNRGFLRAKGIVALNLLSSPGAGKTTLLERSLPPLASQFSPAVINGDLATANDAARLHATGAPVAQITTGNVCHLDAEMVARGLEQLPLDGRRLLFIENVGNLVCPASYDLGEDRRVVLFAVTEGEDKPLKYPPVFHRADLVVISKIDLAAAAGFDRAAALDNLRRVAHHAPVIELSAKTGEGFDAWLDWLRALADARVG